MDIGVVNLLLHFRGFLTMGYRHQPRELLVKPRQNLRYLSAEIN
jgi:hypothetical protein